MDLATITSTVEQQIFVCRKFLRISRKPGDSRKEQYWVWPITVNITLVKLRTSGRDLPVVKNRKDFLPRKCPAIQYMRTLARLLVRIYSDQVLYLIAIRHFSFVLLESSMERCVEHWKTIWILKGKKCKFNFFFLFCDLTNGQNWFIVCLVKLSRAATRNVQLPRKVFHRKEKFSWPGLYFLNTIQIHCKEETPGIFW